VSNVRVQKILGAGTAADIAYFEVETPEGTMRIEFTAEALPILPAIAITTLGIFHQKHGTHMPVVRTQSVELAVSSPEQKPMLVVHPALAKHPFLFALREEDLGPLADAIRQFQSDKG
jgi:hypothetical protein